MFFFNFASNSRLSIFKTGGNPNLFARCDDSYDETKIDIPCENPPNECLCMDGEFMFHLELDTGEEPWKTSWNVQNETGVVVVRGDIIVEETAYSDEFTTFNHYYCLPVGCYDFVITGGIQYYKGYYGLEKSFDGGNFEDQVTETFCGGDDCPLTISPIRSIPNTPFYFDPTEKIWAKCKIMAELNGYTFASIRNQEENDYIDDYLMSNNILSSVWLGGYQTSYGDEPAGNWAWLDGTTWTDSTYTSWSLNQPDNSNNDEHYLELNSLGAWNDNQKDRILPCLFRDPMPITQILSSYFHIDMRLKTWDHCKITAENNGFNFASIRNQTENDVVTDYLKSNNITEAWLGGYQSNYEDEPAGNWAWLDEKTDDDYDSPLWTDFTYTNWALLDEETDDDKMTIDDDKMNDDEEIFDDDKMTDDDEKFDDDKMTIDDDKMTDDYFYLPSWTDFIYTIWVSFFSERGGDPSEPNNSGDDEHYLYIDSNWSGGWGDDRKDMKYPCVFRDPLAPFFNSQTRPIPNTSFYIVKEQKTWDVCLNITERYTFASIRNQEENDLVLDYLESNDIWGVWLGGYQSSGNWVWLDGTLWTDSTYTNWIPGEPTNLNNNKHHLFLSGPEGKWWGENSEHEYSCLFRDPPSSFAQKNAPTTKPTTASKSAPTTLSVNAETMTSTVLQFFESIVTFFKNILPFCF